MEYLLDTSAYWQGRFNAQAKKRMAELSYAEQLAICSPAMLEILFGAQSSREWHSMRAALDTLPRVDLTDQTAAIEAQGLLARHGRHRTPIVDVLVAATAVAHNLTVLHYDVEFERLSEITGAPHEWVVPAGSGS